MKKVLNSLVTGILVLAIGIGYLGNALEIWSGFTIFFPGWWTLFIILPMIYSFINDGFNFFNLTGFAIGAVLLASRLIPALEGKTLAASIAVILILVGIRIIFNPLFRNHSRSRVKVNVNGSEKEIPNPNENGDRYETSFSDRSIDYTDRPFYGAELSTNFGAMKLDLSRALINDDCVIRADTNFGGIKIILPGNIAVKLEKHSFCGGVDNKHNTQNGDALHTVVIYAESNFGGIEIV